MNIVILGMGKKAGDFSALKTDYSPSFMRALTSRLGIQPARGYEDPRHHFYQAQNYTD